MNYKYIGNGKIKLRSFLMSTASNFKSCGDKKYYLSGEAQIKLHVKIDQTTHIKLRGQSSSVKRSQGTNGRPKSAVGKKNLVKSNCRQFANIKKKCYQKGAIPFKIVL